MNRGLIIFAGAGLAILAGGVLLLREATPAREISAAPEVVTLESSLERLISDFNEARGSVRMVFIAGPSCGPCLRGLDDMNRVLGDQTRNDPRLKAFILYVPTLGAKERHALRAAGIMAGPDIHHYWDETGASGHIFQRTLGIGVYAWDIWMVYGRDAAWSEGGPPTPDYWQHQLYGVPSNNRLDPEEFAEKVSALLGSAGGAG